VSTRRASSAPLDGRVSTVIDGTGVARGFTHLIRKVGVTFTPVTITAGRSRSRGEHGYWHLAKSILLSELAAQLETGCRTATTRRRPAAVRSALSSASASRRCASVCKKDLLRS
jgi:hypothetical protein